MKQEYVIITSNENKKHILKKLSEEKKLYNIKFYTFYELKKKIYFDYDNEALEYIMKNYHVRLSVARVYVENLYYLNNGNSKKITFLKELKNNLDYHHLLIYDEAFLSYLKNKEIILYGYPYLTKEQKLILEKIGDVSFYQKEEKNYIPRVFELENELEEVEYVANRISKLYLDGVDLNKIKLIADAKYYQTLYYIFSIYKIPIHISWNHSYYSTSMAQEFLDHYDSMDITENIQSLSSKYDSISDLIKIINRSVMVQDKSLRKEFIIEDLKNTKIPSKIYDKQVVVTHLDDFFSEDEFVFLLGFHIGSYPKIYKNDCYFDDKELLDFGFDTSTDKNKYEKLKVKYVITNIKNLIITCQKSNDKTIFPSQLISEMNLSLKKEKIDLSISYSKLYSKLKYARDLDDLYKYNIMSDSIRLYRHNLSIPYSTYSNQFSGVNPSTLKSRIGSLFSLSYTNLEMYYKCAFQYYISKILRIDIFSENFKMIIGTIAHHVLEIGVSKEINIPVEIMKFAKEKDYTFSAKEYFYLEKLAEELKFLLEAIKEQEKHTKLTNYLFETELYVNLDRFDKKITFKGLIDKIMYQQKDGKETLAVVDYKTGSSLVTLDYLSYGLHMQLPIYLYLLKKSDRFKEASIAGFYIQRILFNSPFNRSEDKTLKEIKIENLKLQGFSNSSTTILEMLDDEYSNSSFIKGLKCKKDGNLANSAKVLSSKEMDELTEIVSAKIEECITNIYDGNFFINPKVIKGDNISCEYCQFRDICFTTKRDEVILGGEEDEVDRGTKTSDS